MYVSIWFQIYIVFKHLISFMTFLLKQCLDWENGNNIDLFNWNIQ